MTTRWLGCTLILLTLCTPARAQGREELLKTLQKATSLTALGQPALFDDKSAAKLAPGLAPQLTLYGFRGALQQQWTVSGQTATSTFYEMLDSPAAYGIYTSVRSTAPGQPTAVLIGAESFERDTELYFWQSRYVVRVNGAVGARNELARTISQNILGRSRKPPVSEYLPPANLVTGSEKYLLSPSDVDAALGVEREQLGFDESAEAAAATYKIGGTAARLLLLLYPTQHVAKKHEEAIDAAATKSRIFRKRAGPLLAIVYGVRDETTATTILSDISHEFKVTWNEPKPDLAIGTLIVTVFTFIGVALFFTVLMGVGFGGLRVWARAHFPNRSFGGPDGSELTQLKLIQSVADTSNYDANPAEGAGPSKLNDPKGL